MPPETIQSSYSPSGNFIHLEQISEGTPKVGQKITFNVYSTNHAVNFYYEVISRGTVVFSDYTTSRDISFSTTPLMAPSANCWSTRYCPMRRSPPIICLSRWRRLIRSR